MRPARRTTALTLIAIGGAGLVIGAGLPPLVVRLGGTPPLLSFSAAVLLVLASAGVGVAARSTWQTVQVERRRMASDRAMLLLALAKASSRAGALLAGAYGGFALAYVDTWATEFGQDRVLRGGAAALAALLLVAAGLVLERACVLPDDDDDDGEGQAEGVEATPA